MFIFIQKQSAAGSAYYWLQKLCAVFFPVFSGFLWKNSNIFFFGLWIAYSLTASNITPCYTYSLEND